MLTHYVFAVFVMVSEEIPALKPAEMEVGVASAVTPIDLLLVF